GGPINFDIFVRANGKEIEMIRTDNNTVLNGTAKRVRSKEPKQLENQNRTMKTISSLAAIFVIALFASPVVASEQVPLNGSFAAVEIDQVQGTTLFVNGSGIGNATHLGRYTVTFEAEVDLLTLMGVGTMTFVAANGDSFSTEVNGQATPTPDPNVFLVVV